MEKISKNLSENVAHLKQLFEGDNTFISRPIQSAYYEELRCYLFFCDGMVSTPVINESIVKPITLWNGGFDPDNAIAYIKTEIIHSNDIKVAKTWEDVLSGVLYGDTALFCEGSDMALVINTKGFQLRSISEPGSEQILSGPREGFTEGIMLNISLIRRKLKTPDLKFTMMQIGKVSKTNCCICYIDGVAEKAVLTKLKRRLEAIDIDGLISSNYIIELICDNPFAALKTVGKTERPDIVAAKLLEGRIALIVDGTPVVLTMPYLLMEQFQSSEDYYVDFYYASLSRLLRIVGFFLSISILPLYISMITFHTEILPTPLLISISAARDGVPLPTIVEALALLLTFELLREAATRTPSVVGQTIGIVGALVLGQAAVEARFVSAPMIIMVAVSGITGLMLPHLRGAITVLRVILIGLTSFLGLYGYIFGIVWFISHVCTMNSFGVSVLSNVTTYRHGSKEDTFYRMPWSIMKRFNRFISRDK